MALGLLSRTARGGTGGDVFAVLTVASSSMCAATAAARPDGAYAVRIAATELWLGDANGRDPREHHRGDAHCPHLART